MKLDNYFDESFKGRKISVDGQVIGIANGAMIDSHGYFCFTFSDGDAVDNIDRYYPTQDDCFHNLDVSDEVYPIPD